MTDLTFGKISSELVSSTGVGGQRDYSVDLTSTLEEGELLDDVDVISKDTRKLLVTTASKAANNTSVNFHVTIVGGASPGIVELHIPFVGNSNSSGTYKIDQPIVRVLTI